MLECSDSKRMFKINLKFQGSSNFFSSLTLKSYYPIIETFYSNPIKWEKCEYLIQQELPACTPHTLLLILRLTWKSQFQRHHQTYQATTTYHPKQQRKGNYTNKNNDIYIYWKHSERTYNCRHPNIPSIHLKQKIHNTEHIENLSTCRSWSILPIQPIQDTNAPQS